MKMKALRRGGVSLWQGAPGVTASVRFAEFVRGRLQLPVLAAPLRRADPVVPISREPRYQSMDVEPYVFAGGAEGYIVWDPDAAKKVLADKRYSADQNKARRAGRVSLKIPRLPGFFVMLDGERHRRYRRALAGRFGRAAAEAAEPMVRSVVVRRLALLAADARGPVDLVSEFCDPVPAEVICNYLGVAPRFSPLIQRLSNLMVKNPAGLIGQLAASIALLCVMAGVVVLPAALSSDSVVRQWEVDNGFSRIELAGVVMLLLAAGHETTSNAIALSVLTDLSATTVTAGSARQEGTAGSTEELVRRTAPVQYVPRVATEPTPLGDKLAQPGDLVCVALGGRAAVVEGDGPRATSSLPYGHGAHQCLGQYLAGVTVRVALTELFGRYPSLSLAVGEPVEVRGPAIIVGLERLWVRLEPTQENP